MKFEICTYMHLKKGKCNWANLTIALIKASWEKSEGEPKQERRLVGTRARVSELSLEASQVVGLSANSSSHQQIPVEQNRCAMACQGCGAVLL